MRWEPVLPPAAGEEVPAGLPPITAGRPSAAAGVLREIPVLVLVAMAAAILVRTFVFQAFYIPSPSMGCVGCPVHTLEINDKVVVSKLSYRLHEPRRGDVIVFECPPAATCANRARSANPLLRAIRWVGQGVGVVAPSTEDYIKRIIALPGETVEARNGHVYVDGRLLEEPYLPPAVVTADFGPKTVPPAQLWVMGDNRQNSGDSRMFGPIAQDTVVGRTVLRLLPLRRIGFL